MAVIEDKTKKYTEPWQAISARTPWENVSIYAPVDNFNSSHANTTPVIFIGDSCHPMVPFLGAALSWHDSSIAAVDRVFFSHVSDACCIWPTCSAYIIHRCALAVFVQSKHADHY